MRSRSSTSPTRELSPRSTRTIRPTSRNGRRWSRSWATSTTARRRCWTGSSAIDVVERRERRHHAAHPRLPGREGRPQDFVRRYAGPRGLHRDAGPRRQRDRHRRAGRGGRRRRHAADRRSRSATRARPRCRSSWPSTRSTCRTPIRTACAASSPPRASQPEDWGGTTQFVRRLRASRSQGLDELLEKVLLVADAELELTANPKRRGVRARSSSRASTSAAARSRRCSSSAARCGSATRSSPATPGARCGRCTTTAARSCKEARPGDPVEILGFDKPPPAGELGRVVENERAGARARAAARRAPAPRAARAAHEAASRSRSSSTQMQEGAVQDLNLVAQGRRASARSRRSSRSSPRSSTPRCASTSSTRASAASPRTTSCWPPRRTRWSSASTCARTPRRARWPSARASRSAPTASSTS